MQSNIPTDIDFQSLFLALSKFSKGDSRFRDFDFEASGLSSIIKLLAVNNGQAAVNTFLALSESHLSTSEILENVQALVTPESGYVPYSMTSARIVADITITPPDPNTAPPTLTLSKAFNATGVGDGATFTFSPFREYVTALVDGVYTFERVTLVEGQRVVSTFNQNGAGVLEFVIPNKNIDTSTLAVTVRNSLSDNTIETWSRFRSAYELGPDAKVYFLSMNRKGNYKLEFGDDRFNKALVDGNIVYASYAVSNGEAANGISSLIATAQVSGFSDIDVSVVSAAAGGSQPEPLESIKKSAIVGQGIEGSLGTAPEFESELKSQFPAYEVKAWGGEDVVPPRPGFILMTTFPQLSEVESNALVEYMNTRTIGSILTSYTPPTEFKIFIQVFYKASASGFGIDSIEREILATFNAFKSEFERFGGTYDPNILEERLKNISGVERAFSSYTMEAPLQQTSVAMTFDYNRKIKKSTFSVKFEDIDVFDEIRDEDGILYEYFKGVRGLQVNSNIDYESGRVSFDYNNNAIATSNSVEIDGIDQVLTVPESQILSINLAGVQR